MHGTSEGSHPMVNIFLNRVTQRMEVSCASVTLDTHSHVAVRYCKRGVDCLSRTPTQYLSPGCAGWQDSISIQI